MKLNRVGEQGVHLDEEVCPRLRRLVRVGWHSATCEPASRSADSSVLPQQGGSGAATPARTYSVEACRGYLPGPDDPRPAPPPVVSTSSSDRRRQASAGRQPAAPD